MRTRLYSCLAAIVLICSFEPFVGILPAQQQKAGASSQGIDALTGPIALYPDALVAQILDAATNPAEVQEFSAWLKQNANLKGSELQEAASKAGFDAAFIAMALFPDVIQMMAQKLDWTKQLGEAFKADAQAVSSSIQRLRQQAQAMGNLKTNQQQQVVTQKASSGEQVIVIQPANPQVVYVPQYNPTVVYTQPAAPPAQASATGAALIGFTAGIIVGAAVNNNNNYYYAGPYAWHRPPVPAPYRYNYNNAAALQQQRYNNAASLQNQRYNNASNLQDQRQANYQQNSTQRQSAAQANQSQRQSAMSSAQSQATANQAQRQAAATSSRTSGQEASQRSGSSGGFSGYQSGSAARTESQRGHRSREASQSRERARRR